MATISSQSTRTAGAVARYAMKEPVAVSAANASVPLFEHELAMIRTRHGKDGVRPKVLTDESGKTVRDQDGAPANVKDSKGNTVYEAKFVQAYALVQSYGHDELDPDDPQSWARAQELGRALVEDRFPGHPALIATEVNGRSGCVHNHIIVGAVHPGTGKSLDTNVLTHSRLAIAHDRVLAEHGFSQREDMQAIVADAERRVARARAQAEAIMPQGLSESQRTRRLLAAENSVKLERNGTWSVAQEREAKRQREHERYLLNEQTRAAARELGFDPPKELFSEIVLESRITAALNDPRSRNWDELAEVGRLHGVAISRRGQDVRYGMLLEQPDGSLAEPVRAHTRRGGLEGSGKGLGAGFSRSDVEAAVRRNADLDRSLERQQEYVDASHSMQQWREGGEFEAEFERLRAEREAELAMNLAPERPKSETLPTQHPVRRFASAAPAVAEPTAFQERVFRSRIREVRSKSPKMQARIDALGSFEERWCGRIPSTPEERLAFEREVSAIGIGAQALKNAEPYMAPELHAYLSRRTAQGTDAQAAVERKKALDDRLLGLRRQAKADPFNARGTADRLRETEADLRFETGYIKRLRDDRAAGLYRSRRHERMEHLKQQAAAMAAAIDESQRKHEYGG